MSDTLYQLWVRGFPADQLRVRRFSGREALSAAYSFDIEVTCPNEGDGAVERSLLGRPAAFTMRASRTPHTVHGFIARAALTRVAPVDHALHLRLRLVPRLWALGRRQASRIFQRMTVPQVVDSVLRQHGIPTEWRLRHGYPEREYCTQYEETDLAFVRRLLAEAGILFFFAQPAEPVTDNDLTAQETMVFADDPSMCAALDDGSGDPAPTLFFLDNEGSATYHGDKITRFDPALRIRQTSTTYREYDPDRPHALLTTYASTLPSAGTPPPLGVSTEGAVAPLGIDLEVYDHHGSFLFPVWGHARDEAGRMLRQARRNAALTRGESHVAMLAPGRRFTLAEHPSLPANRAYIAVTVAHEGRSEASGVSDPEIYKNRLSCVPADVTYCPSRPKRGSVQVALTATVVGPPGEEIHTDALGQIKVRFHWDRAPGGGDQTSCWIRTMQPWGGAGWGHQFIPRVGMEVVVVFEGGDPDKPMVTGTVYNGTHPPPFRLPAEKTRSGVRTQSTPGGQGYNEISFEDAAQSEQLFVHAQRDLDAVVERNRTLLVRADESIRVLGGRSDAVTGSAESSVGGDSRHTVRGDESTSVEGNRIDLVTGSSDERVSGARTLRVEGRDRADITGAADYVFADDLTVRAAGSITTVVGKSEARRSHTLFVEGIASSHATERIELTSEKEIVFRVGKSQLRLTEDKIEISAPTVATVGGAAGLTVGDDGMDMRSKSATQIVSESLLIKTEGASLAMAKEVKVDGEKILLNSPEQAKDPEPPEPPEPTAVELLDGEGNPLAYQRFVVAYEDGSEQTGVTDKDGKAEVVTEKGGTIVFPDLSEVEAG